MIWDYYLIFIENKKQSIKPNRQILPKVWLLVPTPWFKNHPHNDKPTISLSPEPSPRCPIPSTGCTQSHMQGLLNTISQAPPQIHSIRVTGVGRLFSEFVPLGNSQVTLRCSPAGALCCRHSTLLHYTTTVTGVRDESKWFPCSRAFNGVTFKGNGMKSKLLSRSSRPCVIHPKLLSCPPFLLHLLLCHSTFPQTHHLLLPRLHTWLPQCALSSPTLSLPVTIFLILQGPACHFPLWNLPWSFQSKSASPSSERRSKAFSSCRNYSIRCTPCWLILNCLQAGLPPNAGCILLTFPTVDERHT